MFDLDPEQMPPEMANLLLLRGRNLPPLQWHTQPTLPAAKILAELEDAKLFRRVGLASAAMAKGVRALLYLWNGLFEEAKVEAGDAPEVERSFVAAICERQAGSAEVAKLLLQQVGAHPTYAALGRHGGRVLGGVRGAAIVRLLQAVKQGGTWEPLLFVDAHQEALAGKLNDMGVSAVCTLQCIEFELLFRHCCETALGEKLARRSTKSTNREQEARLQEMRKLAERHRAVERKPQRFDSEEPETGQDEETPAPEEARIMIACPKCRNTVDLPESARGQCARCDRCSVAFMVPLGAGGLSSPEASPKLNLIGVRCPKCHEMLMFPEDVRGKPERCGKCGVLFLVPPKKAQTGAVGK